MRRFLPFVFLLLASEASACSVHDHNCQFQGIGRAVNFTVNQNSPTQVVIGSVGSNATDFDNHVLLPDGNGPYIASTLGYTPRADQPYIGSSEQPRHIYPTQYQIDFQNGTAQASYSGDVTGGAFIPNPGGCTISNATYCEEVRIIGNIPDPGTPEGFVVKQTNHIYNFPNDPNPTLDIISYGATTGQAYFKQDSHLGYSQTIEHNGQQIRFAGIRRETLSGTGDVGAEQTYYIGFDNFKAHAAGVVVHNDQRRRIATSVYDLQWGHKTPGGISQYSGNQRKDTYQEFDRVYAHSTDPNRPQLSLHDNVTAQWDVWSKRYNQKTNEGYLSYQREQDRVKSLQAEMQIASGLATQKYCSQPNGVCATSLQLPNYQSDKPNVSEYGRIHHPESDNLYYTTDADGVRYIQKRAGFELTSREKRIYNWEVAKGAFGYFNDNRADVTSQAVDIVAASGTAAVETTIEGIAKNGVEFFRLLPGGKQADFHTLQELTDQNLSKHHAAWREENTTGNALAGASKTFAQGGVLITRWTTSGLESLTVGSKDFFTDYASGGDSYWIENVSNRFEQTQQRYDQLDANLQPSNQAQQIGSDAFQVAELAFGIKAAVQHGPRLFTNAFRRNTDDAGVLAETSSNVSIPNSVDVPSNVGIGANNVNNAIALNRRLTAQEIAGGHGFEKHVLNQGEFSGLGIRTREQYAVHIENVLNNPSSIRYTADGRSYHLQETTGTVVLRNPNAPDGGTAFQPQNWNEYLLQIPTRIEPY